METSVDIIEEEENDNEIKPKMHFTGKVLKTTLAGAILDIGLNVLSVLHISQLVPSSPEVSIKRVEDVLQVGQEVEVWVKKVKEDRIELTMVRPLGMEWRDIKKGMSVKGTVVRLEKFGAFIEIGAERPGLIHISELAHGYVRQPSDVVKEGDEVEAQVLDVNRRKKQIKLSLKALQEEPVKVEEPAKIIETVQKDRTNRHRSRGRGEEGAGSEHHVMAMEPVEVQAEPDPTAMEMAMREAMDRAKSRKGQNQDRGRRNRAMTSEQEDILARTLEHKARNS
jgi:small subunit ribosomal protein S1